MRWVVELPTASDAAAAAVTVEADSWAGALTNARNGVPVKKFRCEFEDDGVVRVTNLETRERYTVRPFKGSLSATDNARVVPASDPASAIAAAPTPLGSESALFGSDAPPGARAPAPEGLAGAPAASGKTPGPSAPARGARERSGTLMAWPDLMADSEPSQVSGTRTMPAKPDRTRNALTRTGQFRAASRSSRPPPRTADAPKPDLPMPSTARAAHESLRSSPPTIPPPTSGARRATSSAIPAVTRTDSGTSPSPIAHPGGVSALRAPSAATTTAPLTPAPPAEAAPPPTEARRAEPPAETPPPPQPAPAEANGVARALNGSSAAAESSALAEALPEPVVLFERNHEPDSHNPLTYRERVLVVPRGTTSEQAEQIARQMLTGLRRSLATRAKGRYVTIAVFDHIFTSRPAYLPLVVVRWKDWRGDPEVIFPDKGPNGNGGGAPPTGSPGPSPPPAPVPPSETPPVGSSPSETNAAPALAAAPVLPEAPGATVTEANAATATQPESAPVEPSAPPVAEAQPEVRADAPQAPAPAPPSEAPPSVGSEGSASERESLEETPIALIPKASPLPLIEKAAPLPLVEKPAVLPLVQKRTQTLLMVASPSPPPAAMESTPPSSNPPAAPTPAPPAAPAPTTQAPAAQTASNARRSTEPKQKLSKSARKKQKRATAEQRLSQPAPNKPASATITAPSASMPTTESAVTAAPETPDRVSTPEPAPAAEAPATPEPAPAAVVAETKEPETAALTEAPVATPTTEPATPEKRAEAASATEATTPAAEPAVAPPEAPAAPVIATPTAPSEPPKPTPTPSERPAPAAAEARSSAPLSKPAPLSATGSSSGEASRRAPSNPSPSATASTSTAPTGKAPPSRCAKGAARRRGKDLLSDLFDALMELSFQTSAEDACAFVAKLLWENLTADACVVSLYDINHDEFVATGAEGAGVVGAREKATRGSRGTAVRRHLAVSHAKVDASESVNPDWCGGPAAFVASYHRERLFGLIQVQRTPGGAVFEPDEEDGISYVAAQLGEFLAQNFKRQAVAEYGDDGGAQPPKSGRPTARR